MGACLRLVLDFFGIFTSVMPQRCSWISWGLFPPGNGDGGFSSPSRRGTSSAQPDVAALVEAQPYTIINDQWLWHANRRLVGGVWPLSCSPTSSFLVRWHLILSVSLFVFPATLNRVFQLSRVTADRPKVIEPWLSCGSIYCTHLRTSAFVLEM